MLPNLEPSLGEKPSARRAEMPSPENGWKLKTLKSLPKRKKNEEKWNNYAPYGLADWYSKKKNWPILANFG